MSVYCPDVAIINGIEGSWVPGESPNKDWVDIRRTYWSEKQAAKAGGFLLGDFDQLAKFLAWTRALQLFSPEFNSELGDGEEPLGGRRDAEP